MTLSTLWLSRLPWFLLSLVWVIPTDHVAAEPEAKRKERILHLTGARVLDQKGVAFLEDRTVILRGDRIDLITTSEAPGKNKDSGFETLALDGLYLIPGLIDLHTHLVLYPYDQTSWNDQVLRESLELRTIRGVTAAEETLLAGFTTIRELGTEGAGFADLALKRAIDLRIIRGPRIFASTRALVATGCYGPSGFDPRWHVPKGAQVADGVDGVRKAVREQIAAGADWIKVYADYRRRPGDRSTPTFSQQELNAIVEEATSAGLPVAAHAVTDEAIRRSVKAGVRTIEHGYEASFPTLELMRKRRVVLCPTLAASAAISKYSGWNGAPPDPPRVTASKTLIDRALRARVTIACGSDAGVFAHGENAWEIELLVNYGLTPSEALTSATQTAAQVLGRERELGRIQADYLADLIAVEENPLEDPRSLRSVRLVIKNGRVVLNRRE